MVILVSPVGADEIDELSIDMNGAGNSLTKFGIIPITSILNHKKCKSIFVDKLCNSLTCNYQIY